MCFRSPELKEIRIAADHLGQPRAWSGQFANVYKGVYGNGRAQAIRVFTRPAPDAASATRRSPIT